MLYDSSNILLILKSNKTPSLLNPAIAYDRLANSSIVKE